MHVKLIIAAGDQEVVFYAHEIIKIALDLMHEQSKFIPKPRLRIPQNNSLPDYSIKYDKFSHTILNLYARKYDIEKGVLDNFLNDMYIAAEYPSLVVPYFMKWQELLNDIKQQKEADPNFQGFLSKTYAEKFLPIPESIIEIDSIKKWIYLANNLSCANEEGPLVGWWVLLADRLIHINYDPNNRKNLSRGQHFYVSDHGELKDVYEQVAEVTSRHSLELDDYNMAIFNFDRFYKALKPQQQNNLKKHFINQVKNLNIHDHNKMQNLLMSFAYRSYAQAEVINGQSLDSQNRASILEESIVDLADLDLEKSNNYDKLESVFEVTLERLRYQAEVRLTSYGKWIMSGAFTVYSTQVNNVMSKLDAELYLECQLLTKLLQEVNHGDRSMLFRSLASYGNRDSGSSYHDFERAFTNYFKQENHLSESKLALVMRNILRGKTPDVRNSPFMPNLVGAWFIAESVRNPLSIISGLMLLDMIENNIKLLDIHGNNWYSWCNTLVHPLKSSNVGTVRDLYGSKINIDLFGGSHPMAHGGSVKDSQEKTISPNTKLTQVRQKEASLMMHWLQLRLSEAGVSCKLVNVAEEKLQQKANFDELCEDKNDSKRVKTLKKKINKDKKTNLKPELDRLIEKQQVQRDFIVPYLLSRLSSLDNLLKPERNIEIFDNQSLHSNDSQDEKILIDQQPDYFLHAPLTSLTSSTANRSGQTATPLPISNGVLNSTSQAHNLR